MTKYLFNEYRDKQSSKVFWIVIRIPLLFLSLAMACQQPVGENSLNAGKAAASPRMVWIAGGEFSMGCHEQTCSEEAIRPHQVKIDGFWIDETEVTNADFEKFVEATNYVTVAERPINWEDLKAQLPPGTPKPLDKDLQPGALVFTPPDGTVLLNDYSQWWSWVIGANWRHPLGPESSIEGMENYPVVQIAYEDAEAFAKWAGKSLPTEAQYEFAARGGEDGKVFSWGEELNPQGKMMANYFQGAFPNNNSVEDGFVGVAPVKSFPANKFGLYDMIGNVWELCSDWFAFEGGEHHADGKLIINPTGPSVSSDPREPGIPKHVSKGGSFLCSAQYCSNYKPSGRQATAFDTGMNHTGFRCVKN